MAKKRKAPSGQSKSRSVPEDDFNKRVRLNVDSYQDVAGSDDEFHMGRDKVLLDEGASQKRLRKKREQEEFLEASDEEVLGVSEAEEDDHADDDEDEEEDDYSDVDGGPNGVTAQGANSDDDDQGEREDEGDEMDEWGASKHDYYGADQMETEQDALDEEAEAKRLQQKQLEAMTAADYGFDEDEWAETGKEDTDKARKDAREQTVTETLPQLRITDDMGSVERLKLLKNRYPEFEPLSKEFLTLQETVTSIRKQRQANAMDAVGIYKDGSASSLETKERAATAYLATLAMYFAVLTSAVQEKGNDGNLVQLANVKDHPIMDSLLSMRELWLKVENLEEGETEDEWEESEEEEDAITQDIIAETRKPRRRSKKKTGAQKAASAAAREAESRRAERMLQAEADLADLDDLITSRPQISKKASKFKAVAQQNGQDSDSDFGEVELSEKALADKAAKRKSLRFYTSQIAQKSNKRGQAGRSAGGDDDIPYRERLRDRQARLTNEAIKKGKSGRDELGGDSDEEDRAAAREVRDEGEDDYYQLISNKKAGAKADKEAFAAAKKDAILNGARVVERDEVGADGKRKISYAIEKNKGLTPRRKKEVRNPRVKKRMKYEQRNKKLGSMKAIYKGGEGKGGYGGEATGIKANLVKSRKL